jgi:hypothetical protein
MERELRASGRPIYTSLAGIPAGAKKAVALFDNTDDVKVDEAAAKAIEILSRNPKGYFLMVEWDLHPTRPEKALDTVVALDRLIEKTAKGMASKDTLVLFTADHSFDFRLLRGKRGAPSRAAGQRQGIGRQQVRRSGRDEPYRQCWWPRTVGAQRVKGSCPTPSCSGHAGGLRLTGEIRQRVPGQVRRGPGRGGAAQVRQLPLRRWKLARYRAWLAEHPMEYIQATDRLDEVTPTQRWRRSPEPHSAASSCDRSAWRWSNGVVGAHKLRLRSLGLCPLRTLEL